MQSYEAEQAAQQEPPVETDKEEPFYSDVLECPNCDQAIKLNQEQQATSGLNCPNCAFPIPSAKSSEPVSEGGESKASEDSGAESLENQTTQTTGTESEKTLEQDNGEKTLPELISCVACERALFLSEEDRESESLRCGHCGHEHLSSDLKQAAASEPVETPVANEAKAEPSFPELIECSECQRAIKLLPEERDVESTTCPYCQSTIAAPKPDPILEPEVLETAEDAVDSPIFDDDDVPEKASEDLGDVAETPADPIENPVIDSEQSESFEEEGESEAIALFDDEQEQAEELAAADDPENQNEIGADVDIALFGDEPDTEVGTEEESDNKADSDLLESMIETSRNKSVMPECFQCPKCDTEIVLPEAERMMGLCFCPECEELIDSNTAQAHIVEKEDAEESEGESISVSDETEESEDVALEAPVEEESQPDAGSAIEDAAEEMEFWLDEVLPDVVDCVKCRNSLKLDDEEKMFGIYHCPYCKANINHAKGEVVQSIMGVMEEGGEEEEEAPKRKPIKINFQALKPFAAVLVFAATLFYGVIKTAEYYIDRKNQKLLLITQIDAVKTNMEGRQKIYESVLSSEKNKVQLAKMEKMSISELKELQSNLGVEKEKAYAEWFEKKGKEIGQKGDGESNQLADQFRQQMEQFNIRMRLTKLDSHNLANAIGLSKFERTEGTRLVQGHINAIKKMLDNISKHKAIEMGLVRNEVLQDLMNVQSKLENFEAKSARDAVSHLETLSDITVDLETYFPLAKSGDFIGLIDKPIRKREKVKEGSTPWNGEMLHWADSKSVRDQEEWDEVVTEYEKIYKSLREFHDELKEVKNSTLEFSELNHRFLEGATLQSTVDKFRNLDGVRELVSSEMEGRLDKIATLLNPDEPGTLAHQIRARQASGLPLNQSEIDLFYERFYEKWEPFLIEKDWFSFQEMSSYYHLAKPRFSSISRATSTDE